MNKNDFTPGFWKMKLFQSWLMAHALLLSVLVQPLKSFSTAGIDLMYRHLNQHFGGGRRHHLFDKIRTATFRCATMTNKNKVCMMGDDLKLQVSTVMGLEALVKQELEELGYSNCLAKNGRVEVQAPSSAIPRLNINLRTANRVLLEVLFAARVDLALDKAAACGVRGLLLRRVLRWRVCNRMEALGPQRRIVPSGWKERRLYPPQCACLSVYLQEGDLFFTYKRHGICDKGKLGGGRS